MALCTMLAGLGYKTALNERRSFERQAVDEEARLIIPSESMTLACRVVDISDGGAGILCDAIPQYHTRVTLVMKDGRKFEAITAWFEEERLGLQFLPPFVG
jgi:hypothetical protein